VNPEGICIEASALKKNSHGSVGLCHTKIKNVEFEEKRAGNRKGLPLQKTEQMRL
jgi:hypothetical protein